MESNNTFPKIVRLSVGGVHFTTSIDTLLSDSNSMLAAMFSGRHNVSKDEEGRYFIDRDGTHFRYILNYLRDGNAFIPFDNQQLVDELYEEVCFFQIEDLQRKLEQEKASHQSHITHKISYIKLMEIINIASKPVVLPRLSLSKMNLSYLNLSNINLRGSNLTGITANESYFIGAKLIDCIFNDATLKNANMQGCVINNSSFKNANMSNVILTDASCKGCNFYKARLVGARMVSTDLQESNFQEAELVIATLERASCHGCIWTGTIIDRTNLKDAKGLPPGLTNINP